MNILIRNQLPVVVLLCFLTSASAKSPWTPERNQAVVRLEIPIPGGTKPRIGTGFVVQGLLNRQFVVAATHVIYNTSIDPDLKACIALPTGTRLLVGGKNGISLESKCAYNISSDISLIELVPSQTTASSYSALSLDVAELVRKETLHVAGFPFGYSLDDARSGIVTELNGENDFAVVEAFTAPGMSGGPYVRQDGSVVAVHHGQSGSAAGFAHAVHISRIRNELEAFLPPLASQSKAWFGTPEPDSRYGIILTLRNNVGTQGRREQLFVEIFGRDSLTHEMKFLLSTSGTGPSNQGITTQSSQPSTGSSGANDSIQSKTEVVNAYRTQRTICLSADKTTIVNGLLYCNGESQFSPSPNFGPEIAPKLVVVHFTGMESPEIAIRILREKGLVSAHVLIDRDGSLLQFVNFTRKAWHAGASEWRGLKELNNHSIGIMLVNAGRILPADNSNIPKEDIQSVGTTRWHKYTYQQVVALEKVLQTLATQYPIKNIVGHCEIRKGYKIDPGPLLNLTQIEQRILNLPDERSNECSYDF